MGLPAFQSERFFGSGGVGPISILMRWDALAIEASKDILTSTLVRTS